MRGKSEASQRRIEELTRQLSAVKVELASRKSKAEKIEKDLQFKLDEAKGSFSALNGECKSLKLSINRFKAEAENAKKDAKEYAAVAREVSLSMLCCGDHPVHDLRQVTS